MFIPYFCSSVQEIKLARENKNRNNFQTVNTDLLVTISVYSFNQFWQVKGKPVNDGTTYILAEFKEKSEAESFCNSLINKINKAS